MKKLTLLAVLSATVFLLCSCVFVSNTESSFAIEESSKVISDAASGGNSEEAAAESSAAADAQSEASVTESSAAAESYTLKASFDFDLEKIKDYHEYKGTGEFLTAVLVETDAALAKVQLFNVEMNGEGALTKGNVFYELDELNAAKPLVADIYFNGSVPQNGMCFDFGGETVYYIFDTSGKDGSLIFQEAEFAE